MFTNQHPAHARTGDTKSPALAAKIMCLLCAWMASSCSWEAPSFTSAGLQPKATATVASVPLTTSGIRPYPPPSTHQSAM